MLATADRQTALTIRRSSYCNVARVKQIFIAGSFMTEEDVLALAPHVERLGYDGMSFADHLFMPHTEPGSYPYSEDGNPPFPLDTPWPDGLVLMAAAGAATKRIRFLNTILILPLRHPIHLAKAAATAARVTGGRIMLGVGIGWQREEFDALGLEFENRGARANEMIPALRTLWQKGAVEHHGRFFDFGPLLMEPVPPRIPIIVGGSSDAAFRRAAKYGDGAALPLFAVDEIPGQVARLGAALAEEGRALTDFETIVPVRGASVEQIASVLELDIAGVGLSPWPWPSLDSPVEQKLELLEEHAESILKPLRALSA